MRRTPNIVFLTWLLTVLFVPVAVGQTATSDRTTRERARRDQASAIEAQGPTGRRGNVRRFRDGDRRTKIERRRRLKRARRARRAFLRTRRAKMTLAPTPLPTPTLAGLTSQAVLAGPPMPILEIFASADNDPVRPGELVTYTLTFSNAGSVATGVSITASTPPGTVFESASPAAFSDPGPGGVGLITWNTTDLTTGGGGTVTFTVMVGAALLPNTNIVLSGYDITSTVPVAANVGPDVGVVVQLDVSLAIQKIDSPDPVQPGETLTYEIVVSNEDEDAVQDLVVRELFDPNLTILSSDPEPDFGTTDRWSIDFLPGESFVTITVEAEVNAATPQGTIIRNFAEVTDPDNRRATTYEDTQTVSNPRLRITIDDLPDPIGFLDDVVYAITFSNLTNQNLTGVVVNAVFDPSLTPISFSPAPDGGTMYAWTIGTLLASSSDRIYATFRMTDPTVPDGQLLPARAWVTAGAGFTASTNEVTLYTEDVGPDGPYLMTMTGAPRFLRIGVVEEAVYMIKLRNRSGEETTGLVLKNDLPAGMTFVQSVPPPDDIEDNELLYLFPSLAPGESKLIVIKARLDEGAVPGMTLLNRASVLDDQRNSIQASFEGGVRPGRIDNPGRLQVRLTMPTRLIIAGNRSSRLRTSISIINGGRGDAENVVVTLRGPEKPLLTSSIPGVSMSDSEDGIVTLTWIFPRMKGPGNETIKLIHEVPPHTPHGYHLNFAAEVRADDGRMDSDAAVVEIKNRN